MIGYYTKNPKKMKFINEEEFNKFFDSLENGSAFKELLERENKYSIRDISDEKIKSYMNEKREDALSNTINFNYYSIPYNDDFAENVNTQEFANSYAYDIDSFFAGFATAYDTNYKGSYRGQQKVRDALTMAVKNGADVEVLKMHLAKILNEQTADLKSRGKESMYRPQDIMETERLLRNAEDLSKDFSPYENIFKMGEEMASLKDKTKNLQGAELDRAEVRLADMETAFDKECAKFDPEILFDIANERKEYYKEVDKNMAILKGEDYDLSSTMRTSAYQSTNVVGLYAKSAIKSQERMRSENY